MMKRNLLTKHLQFVWVIIDRRRSPPSGPSLSRYYGILQFFFGHDLFTRYAPSDFGPCRRLHPVSEQQSIPWFPDAKWTPVPGGLEDHPDFLRYMSLAENSEKTSLVLE